MLFPAIFILRSPFSTGAKLLCKFALPPPDTLLLMGDIIL